MLPTRDSLEIQRHKRLKEKGWKNIFRVNTNQKTAGGLPWWHSG